MYVTFAFQHSKFYETVAPKKREYWRSKKPIKSIRKDSENPEEEVLDDKLGELYPSYYQSIL